MSFESQALLHSQFLSSSSLNPQVPPSQELILISLLAVLQNLLNDRIPFVLHEFESGLSGLGANREELKVCPSLINIIVPV